MKLPKIIFLAFIAFSASAQDSLPKTKLRLFDLNLAATATGKESADLRMSYVKSFAKENYSFLSDDYTKGYSDTAQFTKALRGPKRGKYHPPANRYGSVYGQIGINASFKFVDANDLLERIKPRIGIYHSSRKFFSYNIAINERYPTDTLFFSDPKYPPIISDSVVFKNINYQYTSKQFYAELGCNLDVFRSRFFILYGGVLFGYGISYKNEFYMRKDEYIDYGAKPHTISEVTVNEPGSRSKRLTVPMGVLIRFSKRKHFAPGFYAECSPGFESYKIKGGRTLSHPICAFTWGFRFNFQPHMSS